MLSDAPAIVERLKEFQLKLAGLVATSHGKAGFSQVSRTGSADTIYRLDELVEPMLIEFCTEWGRQTPLAVVAEGLADESGGEGERFFGGREGVLRLIVDPVDGTRGLMYDKRAAWTLAGVAADKGASTRLRDIDIAVMTELPTSKMDRVDQLWAVKGQGTMGRRMDLRSGQTWPLAPAPSRSPSIEHGFAMVASFFPQTKVLAAQLMDAIVAGVIDSKKSAEALVFDDQYICTGGQFYELVMGHDRFNADVRPLLYRIAGRDGLCCHPYDCAAALVATEAGVILADGLGGPLDGPLDVTSPISWIGYANEALRQKIEPLLKAFFAARLPA